MDKRVAEYRSGVGIGQLADRFGVHRDTIYSGPWIAGTRSLGNGTLQLAVRCRAATRYRASAHPRTIVLSEPTARGLRESVLSRREGLKSYRHS
jgi:hypothetical protein